MDINNLNFIDEFDIIYSNAALHWVTDHHRLLHNSYTALKTDGIILWEFGSDGNTVNFLEVIQRNIIDDDYKDYFKDFEFPWFFLQKNSMKKWFQILVIQILLLQK